MRIPADTAYALVARTMRAMQDGRLAPQAGGERIWRAAGRALWDAPRTLSALWTLWGAFTEPALVDREAAPALMLRAAADWLALAGHAEQEACLERWLNEELGYGATVSSQACAVHSFRRLLAAAARDKSTLTPMLPKHAGDVESAQALVALGYPAVAPVLPHLFQWLETNSPVERVLSPFFASLGAPARDLACAALLARNKPARKHTLLRQVLPAWPRKVLATLPLERFLYDGDAYGLDVWALKLMAGKGIPTHDGLRGLAEVKEYKTAHLRELLQVLDDLALPTFD